jgi:polyferredoxin
MKWIKEQEEFNKEPLSIEDIVLYKQIAEELKNELGKSIPANFAMNVARKQSKKDSLWADIRLYAVYSLLFTLLVAVCIGFFLFDTSVYGTTTTKLLIDNMGYVIMGSFIFFTIQTLDRVFIKAK